MITTLDMRILELNTVGLGIPLRLLMEAAGKSVADYVDQRLGRDKGKRIVVLAGKGGNGGDAMVAARYLAGRGYHVDLVPAYSFSEITHPDTRSNAEIIRRMTTLRIHRPGDTGVLGEADVVIDGLLGTGVRGELRGVIRRMVEEANASAAELRVAIDTPTGLNPDTGEIHGAAFRADATVTFHDEKPGLRKRSDVAGEIIVANIGVPREAWLYTGPGDVVHGVPGKPRDAHKGVGGKVLVVGGSYMYTGAPALAGLAALYAGADLAFILVPEKIRGIIAGYSPDLITIPVPGEEHSLDNMDLIDTWVRRSHVVVLGPGLGRSSGVKAFVEEFIERYGGEKPLVVDADALKMIRYGEHRFRYNAVLTPHRGEFRGLTGLELTGDPFMDAEKAMEASRVLEAVVLLKAPVDIIAAGDRYRLNRTGNPGMSAGGTGDILSGITAAFYARAKDPFRAAAAAAYVNGLLGDYVAIHGTGEHITATTMLRHLQRVLMDPLRAHLETYLGIDTPRL